MISKNSTNRIAIFASGEGTNAEAIINHLKNHERIKVGLIVGNNPGAKVFEKAKKYGIASVLLDKQNFYHTEDLLKTLKEHQITFIVLAGFLWFIPGYLIREYDKRLVNIHPALLPKFGGKGMYGIKVHEAVIDKDEKETGISIHYVNGHYDEGEIIFQAKCEVTGDDTPETIRTKVQQLELRHYPLVIEKVISGKLPG